MSRDTGYGESKRALAANTSCACCFGAFCTSALAITWSRPYVPRDQKSSRSLTESRSMDRSTAETDWDSSSRERIGQPIDREARPARWAAELKLHGLPTRVRIIVNKSLFPFFNTSLYEKTLMVNIMFLFCYPADRVYTDWVILRDCLVGGFIVEVTWEGKMSERRNAGG